MRKRSAKNGDFPRFFVQKRYYVTHNNYVTHTMPRIIIMFDIVIPRNFDKNKQKRKTFGIVQTIWGIR